MNFDLKKPCSNCPFLKEGGIRLHPGRADDIAGMMLDWDGGTFACHKTAIDCEEDEEEGGRKDTRYTQHCAGALIYAIKNDNFTQMMRIAGRLGWDPDAMIGHDDVIDDPEEMYG